MAVVKLEKYIGRTVEIIYQDRHGKLGQRQVRVQAMDRGMVKAYDLNKQAPRVFCADRILAVQPVARRAAV